MEGCMDGVNIVELGHVVAVPSAAAILADWGANVIKVEAPGVGDQARSYTHLRQSNTNSDDWLSPSCRPVTSIVSKLGKSKCCPLSISIKGNSMLG